MKSSKFKVQSSKWKLKIKNLLSLIHHPRSIIHHPNNGFTLLELLVSISIIGVLISLAAVSYSSAQKKGRDAKRQGDLKAIQNAMEQYYSSCGYAYPTAMPGDGFSCGTSTLLEKFPTDPKTAEVYPSGAAFDGLSYKVCANTEIVATPYCVSNLQ